MQFIDHATFLGGKSKSLDQAVDAGRATKAADLVSGLPTVLSSSVHGADSAAGHGRDFWSAFLNRKNPDVTTPSAGGHPENTRSDPNARPARTGHEGAMPCGWQGLDPTN